MPWVEPIARRAAWATIAAIVVAFLALAKSFVIPIALALLFAFLLSPVVSKLHASFRSRILAVVLTCGVAFSVVAGAGYVVMHQMVDFADQLPSYKHTIAQKIIALRGSKEGTFARLQHALADIKSEVASSSTQPAESRPVTVVATGSESSGSFLPLGAVAEYISPVIEPLTLFFIVCILVMLLLVDGEDLRDRVIVLAGTQQVSVTTQALEEASKKIGRYLLMQAIINLTFAVIITTGLFFIGIPNALLLGLLAGAMRFIPVVGAWCGALLPAALAVAVFDHWSPLIYVGVLFAATEALMNFIMEPLLYGMSTGISGVAVLVAILFWTWIWGPLGLLLAVPITVCLVVLGKHLEPLRVFYVLLGDEPMLAGETRLYHRLVAGDTVSAEQIVTTATLELGEARVCDELLLPVLQTARADLDRGNLSEEKYGFILDTLSELGAELPELINAEGAIACVGVQRTDTVAARILSHAMRRSTDEPIALLDSSLLSELSTQIEQRHIALLLLVATSGDSVARARLLAKGLANRGVKARTLIADLGGFSHHFAKDGDGKAATLESVTDIIQRIQQIIRERLPTAGTAAVESTETVLVK